MRASVFVALLVAALLLSARAIAQGVPTHFTEGDLQGYSTLLDANGRPIGKGHLVQKVDGGRLRVHITSRYDDGRTTTEELTLALRPQLAQESWDFEEKRGEQWTRRFSVDLLTGRAVALTRDKHGEIDRKTETLDIARGKTFAGAGFLYAVKQLAPTLAAGRDVDLEAVGFTPKPRTARVTLSRNGTDRLPTGPAARYTIHPHVNAIAKLFVEAPDTTLWLTTTSPPQVLRVRTTIAEPDDPTVIVDITPRPTE